VPERFASRILRSTGKKPENENGADQTCVISLPVIRLEKGFSTASTFDITGLRMPKAGANLQAQLAGGAG